jgi:hypothetical protein
MFGVTTYYRHEADGSLSLKLEGKLEGVPIFEQVAVLREIDLHQTWAPFCTSSVTLKEIDKLDTVAWFVMGAPNLGLARDGCFRAVGCDNMLEDGSVIICGQGLKDREDKPGAYLEPFLTEGLEDIEFPEAPSRLGCGRMTIRNFSAVINIFSADCFETKLVANIDPHLPLPQSLLDFVTRKICGVVIFYLQQAAKKVGKDPIKNVHARRMRRENRFYRGWLLPKFEAYCEMMNWSMPKVPAFQLTDEELEMAADFEESTSRRCVTVMRDHETMAEENNSTDTVSRLTTGSHHSKFPIIGGYLQEMEARATEKKEQRIAAERRRAENRLKPKELTDPQVARLQQLREAKERRNRNRGVPETSIEVDTPSRQRRKPAFSKFHRHGRGTRFLVAALLCSLLTVTLYPGLLFHRMIDKLEVLEASNWRTEFLLDAGTLAYVTFCTIVHFIACDIFMIYAFDALDLGMKTGKQSKKYYNDQVRVVVLTMSVCIAAFGIGNALLAVAARGIIWYSLLGANAVVAVSLAVQESIRSLVPPAIISIVGMVLSSVVEVTGFIAQIFLRLMNFLLWLLYIVFIQSNRFGHVLEVIAKSVMKTLPFLQAGFMEYVQSVSDIYEDVDFATSWRQNAIDNTRFLFAYTSVFLLSILVLFNASSRASKAKAERHVRKSYSGLEDERLHLGLQPFIGSEVILSESMSLDGHDDYSISVLPVSTSGSEKRRFKFKLRRNFRRSTSSTINVPK